MSKPLYTEDFMAFSAYDHVALAALIRRVAKPGCRMAEVGSWLGNGSTQVFLQELRSYGGSSVLCVDTWAGIQNFDRHQDIVEQYDVLGTFRSNVAKANSPVSLQTLVASSVDAASLIADDLFDLVFIDADHSYDAVRKDIAVWRPKVRTGGILCGHDCEMRGSDAVLKELADHRNEQLYVASFGAVHPGCVIAVHEAFDGKAGLFADMPLTLSNGDRGSSKIWFVEMGGA